MDDRYEYFRRTLAEQREERRRRRKISYLIRTAATRIYENLMRSKILLLINIAALVALIVGSRVPSTSPTYRLAMFIWFLLFGIGTVVQGVICRKQSSDWMEVRGVLQKRSLSKWPANVTIALGVLMCLLASMQIPRLLR
jgi:hypothetical protein